MIHSAKKRPPHYFVSGLITEDKYTYNSNVPEFPDPTPPHHNKTYHFESVKKKFTPKRLRAKSKFPKLFTRSPNRKFLDISNSNRF